MKKYLKTIRDASKCDLIETPESKKKASCVVIFWKKKLARKDSRADIW